MTGKKDALLRANAVYFAKCKRTLNTLQTFATSKGHNLDGKTYEIALKLYNDFSDAIEKIEINNISLQEKDSTDVLDISKECDELFSLLTLDNSTEQKPVIQAHASFKVPKISLPVFSGEPNQWINFKNLFDSSVHNSSVFTPCQKLQCLRTHLSGHALSLVETLPITDVNYQTTYDILCNRYSNKRSAANHYYALMKNYQIKENSHDNLKHYLSTFQSSVNALLSLDINMQDFLLLQLALHKLPSDVRMLYEQKQTEDDNKIPTFQDLIKFITNLERSYEIIQAESPPSSPPSTPPVNRRSFPGTSGFKGTPNQAKFVNKSAKTLLVQTSQEARPNTTCFHCNGNHKIFNCEKFQQLPVDSRYNVLRQHKRCFACFSTHPRANCTSNKSCRTCNSKSHNTMLCQTNVQSSSVNSTPSSVQTGALGPVLSPSSCANSQNATFSCHASTVDTVSKIVLLGTAKVLVKDAYGQCQEIRAVLDSGSQRSIITADCAARLALKQCPVDFTLTGINSQVNKATFTVDLSLRSRDARQRPIHVQSVVMDRITSELPSINLHKDVAAQFSGLQLADPDFYRPAKVDLLIGSDVYPYCLSDGPRSVIKGNPSAISTMFGYVLVGTVVNRQSFSSRQASSTTLFSTLNDRVDLQLKRFWEIEEVETPKSISPQDQYCEDLFVQTTTRVQGGRYMVSLPVAPEATEIGSNRPAAVGSFLNLEHRLSKNPEVQDKYNNFMQEYLDLGHMSVAHTPSSYIIPNHCVFKRHDPHAKIRVVFNASSPDHTGVSLNERLLAGPKLQSDLQHILISFSTHKFVITADCRQMYRQIILRPEDRHLQHIFWRSDSSQPLQEYELATVTYGLKPSAYLAQRSLKLLISDEGSSFPRAAYALEHHTFVDDLVTGTDTFEEAVHLIKELNSMLSLSGFELRKWTSNNPALIAQFPPEHLENPFIFSDENQTVKILGIRWCPSSDTFSYNYIPFKGKITKRSILSYISQFFDPLGWLSPVVFWAKCFMQRLWTASLDWDDPLCSESEEDWKKFVVGLSAVSEISFPRRATIDNAHYRLIGFCDASQHGFAAAVYLHSESNDNRVNMQLLVAKSRVAPLKTVSIPRLELNAAVLLSRLIASTQQVLSTLPIQEIRLYTDASTVLDWLNTPSYKLKTYVANRVVTILELTALKCWAHIPTHSNPADVGSRGCTAATLQNSGLWWKGPPQFHVSSKSWPLLVYSRKVHLEIPELKPVPATTLVVTSPERFTDFYQRMSSFQKLIRVFAYIHRFVNHSRKHMASKSTVLSVKELKVAELTVVRLTQQDYFDQEIACMKKGKIPDSLRSLSPFISNDGILRAGGRLCHSVLPDRSKFPMLLPKKSHLTDLAIDHFHTLGLHSGPRTTQGLINQTFWIPCLRSTLRARLRKCVKCFKMSARPSQPIMASLPMSRVTPQPAFLSTGIDYAGPFSTKDSRLRKPRTYKSYLCVFVCMVTRAVHLEVVSDLSTEAFLATLDRFIARRGLPSDLYSDNGRNFVGASRHLRDLCSMLETHSDEIAAQLAKRKIQWHFNPPYAPNFGGIWEAAVKSAKGHLYRTLGDVIFTFEEYCTIFTRIEAILNSRPLCDMSPDPSEELDFLTPGHFLVGRSLLSAPEEPQDNVAHPRQRWTHLRQIVQSFWKRWSKSYLHSQLQRSKWNKNSASLHEGQLVLLQDGESAPLHWPVGRILSLHPAPDSVTRVLTIRTANGTVVRPVNKVAPFPVL